MEIKKIPCRVCGKLFEPCNYCQSHSDIFRWRNFACSRECAIKYIDETIAYRNSQRIENSEESKFQKDDNKTVATEEKDQKLNTNMTKKKITNIKARYKS